MSGPESERSQVRKGCMETCAFRGGGKLRCSGVARTAGSMAAAPASVSQLLAPPVKPHSAPRIALRSERECFVLWSQLGQPDSGAEASSKAHAPVVAQGEQRSGIRPRASRSFHRTRGEIPRPRWWQQACRQSDRGRYMSREDEEYGMQAHVSLVFLQATSSTGSQHTGCAKTQLILGT